jgi:hypothetical protein
LSKPFDRLDEFSLQTTEFSFGGAKDQAFVFVAAWA